MTIVYPGKEKIEEKENIYPTSNVEYDITTYV